MDVQAVWAFLDQARAGDLEGAFHGLRELDHSAMPVMQAAFRVEEDPGVRSLLVELSWQHSKSAEVIGFLAEAWEDPAPEVWKQALDGLVAIASPEAEELLSTLAVQEIGGPRNAWIDEAITQVRDGRVARG